MVLAGPGKGLWGHGAHTHRMPGFSVLPENLTGLLRVFGAALGTTSLFVEVIREHFMSRHVQGHVCALRGFPCVVGIILILHEVYVHKTLPLSNGLNFSFTWQLTEWSAEGLDVRARRRSEQEPGDWL